MNVSNVHKKAQSLPLNTIVIAILVVIVLLIIIVSFTDSFTDSGQAIDDTTSCSLSNPALLGYSSATAKEKCDDDEERTFLGKVTDADKEAGKILCCVSE